MKTTPLMKLDIKETDTKEIIARAKAIAKLHTHYISEGMQTKARFVTYVTEEDAERINSSNDKNRCIRIPSEESVFSTEIFRRALTQAREELKKKK